MTVRKTGQPASKAPASAQPSLRLRVTAAAESALRRGEPWIFAESIRNQNREGEAGELGIIYDRNNKFLAAGLFDPQSPIRLRVLQPGKPQTIDGEWWVRRLRAALERRAGLFDNSTNGFRYINGESDGWPGLVLDRYDRTLVLKLYTIAWLPWLPMIVPLFHAELAPERIVLRLSRNIASEAAARYGKRDGEVIVGPPISDPIIFLESGLRFAADVVRGQKTGFFLDQRENRRRIAQLARGRAVLNAFRFSGGFSLYAARGGAKSVTDLDISAHALAAAKRNFALNQISSVAECAYEQVQADAFEWLQQNNNRRQFGLGILDPPSLARRESERTGAIRAYGKLAVRALQHLQPSGILLACSCSAHVTADEFFNAVRTASTRSGRRFEEVASTRHPPDHPATFKAAEYLKAIYLRFD
jgi:23S rRNA (cytosine1962-C5)-methyltransferase